MQQFAILVSEHSAASVVHGLYDLFCSPGRDWEVLVEGRTPYPLIQPVLVAAETNALQCANGLWITPQVSMRDCGRADVIIIPELVLPAGPFPSVDYQQEIDWLRRQHAQGSLIATACTGAMLLAETGLLADAQATTHWSVAENLRQRLPTTEIDDRKSLVVSGQHQRIVMAGGATSFLDLGLYLIARFIDIEQAMRTARIWLIDWHDTGQQPYASLTVSRQIDDPLIARSQHWIALNYDTPAPVSAMVAHSGISERSFKRRFKQATGMTPIDYVHTLRIEEAKQMLEASDIPIDRVIGELGYEDNSFFGRLFKRKVGVTPKQYRNRFGSMRRALLQTLLSRE